MLIKLHFNFKILDEAILSDLEKKKKNIFQNFLDLK